MFVMTVDMLFKMKVIWVYPGDEDVSPQIVLFIYFTCNGGKCLETFSF